MTKLAIMAKGLPPPRLPKKLFAVHCVGGSSHRLREQRALKRTGLADLAAISAMASTGLPSVEGGFRCQDCHSEPHPQPCPLHSNNSQDDTFEVVRETSEWS